MQITAKIVLQEENLPKTTTEKSEVKTSSKRGNKTSASKGMGKNYSSLICNKSDWIIDVAISYYYPEESPKMSPTETNPISSALHLSREHRLEEEKRKDVMEDTTIKDDIEVFAEDKKWSESTSSEGANVQPCCEDVHFNLMKSSG